MCYPRSGNNTSLDESELNMFANNALNLIKREYIEKQKKVIIDFQKRCKLLKQQEQHQVEFIGEIADRLSTMSGKRDSLRNLLAAVDAKQKSQETR